MQQDLKFYEKKILQDKEFPMQVQNNRRVNIHERRTSFTAHWHEHIELHYIVSGKEEIMLDQKKIVAREGDLVVVNANVLHAGHCEEDYEELVYIFEMPSISKELADKNMIFQQIVSNDPVIRGLMDQLYHEVKNRDVGHRVAYKGILLQLLVHLSRHYVVEMLTDKESVKRMKKLERLNTVNRYIQSHYPETITNKELAELVHLSEDRFNHLFKECMGTSPLQYINEIRLKKAMNLLKAGEYSATEVAEMVGFADYNYFGRQFRKAFGCTPTQVQKGTEG